MGGSMFTELEAWDLVTQILSSPGGKPRGFAGSKKAVGVFAQRLEIAFRAFKCPIVNMDPLQDLNVGIRDNIACKNFGKFLDAFEEMIRTSCEQAYGGATDTYVRSASIVDGTYIVRHGGVWQRLCLSPPPGYRGLDGHNKLALILHVTDWPWGDQELMSIHRRLVDVLFEKTVLYVVYVSAEKDIRPRFSNDDRDWIVLG